MFPTHHAPTRFGIEQGLRGEPHRSPGCYGPDTVRNRTLNVDYMATKYQDYTIELVNQQPISFSNSLRLSALT